MSYGKRLGICVLLSAAFQLWLVRSTEHLRPPVQAAQPVVVHVQLTEPPPPEPEPPPAEPTKQPIHEAPVHREARVSRNVPRQATPPKTTPTPTERPATTENATNTPVFGLSMESTSTAGSGPGMAVGNTLQTEPSKRPGQSQEAGVKPLIPVQPYEVTKMPLPKGDCSGHYTEAAREAGLEGVVIFDLVVDEHGKARDLTVVQGLGSGLTEAAKRALQACNFSPGERDGKPVPVRVRSFKIRFRLRESE